MRNILVGAAMVLVAGLTAACGGGSPDDASEKNFCEAIRDISKAGDFDGIKDAFKNLEDVGTPKSISDDERKGFEISLDLADEADSEDDADKAQDDLDNDDKDKVTAFTQYVAKTCADELSE